MRRGFCVGYCGGLDDVGRVRHFGDFVSMIVMEMEICCDLENCVFVVFVAVGMRRCCESTLFSGDNGYQDSATAVFGDSLSLGCLFHDLGFFAVGQGHFWTPRLPG